MLDIFLNMKTYLSFLQKSPYTEIPTLTSYTHHTHNTLQTHTHPHKHTYTNKQTLACTHTTTQERYMFVYTCA